MKKICLAILSMAGNFIMLQAQDSTAAKALTDANRMAIPSDANKTAATTDAAKALTMAEYEKAKTFSPGDLDKDSYVKFENAYILDRNDFGKPYFITGDDGLKKRIDLYKLIRKEGRTELATIIFYTTEGGKRYMACLPGFKADGKIWEKYFEDIHAIDKEEKNFVLKLSYVLSRELGFQLYRAGTTGGSSGREREAGTYGNDICFPGNTLVTMADGNKRLLSDVKPGDAIVTIDPATKQAMPVRVKELTVHEARNYAITRVLLVGVVGEGHDVLLLSRWLQATPNHPVMTTEGEKNIGALTAGDKVLCPVDDNPVDGHLVGDNMNGHNLPGDGLNGHHSNAGKMTAFTVWDKEESPGGVQRVYNIVAGGGTTFIMNGVVVLQKPLKN